MRIARLDHSLIALGLGLGLLVACSGQLSEEEEEDPVTPTQPKGTPAPTPDKPRPPLPADRAAIPACKNVEPGPAPVRRLNRREYNNTIRDLLGLDTNPGRDYHIDLPFEERRFGFDNNANVLSVSPLLAEQYLMAAEKLATAAVETQLPRLLQNCNPDTSGEQACVDRFFRDFVKRAYRRPPLAEETKILRDAFDIGRQQDLKTGLKLALMIILQSPQFLYRLEVGQPPKAGESYVALTPHEMASRLSYMLWNTQPDSTLINAADQNRLSTPEQIAAQVARMMVEGAAGMQTPHSRVKKMVEIFHDQWLELEKLLDVEKDQKVFPLNVFPKAHLSLMEIEVQRFLDEAFWNEQTGGTLTALLTAPFTYVEPALYRFYGGMAGGLVGAAPTPAAMGVTRHQRIQLDGVKRGGLLTQGALLVTHSNANQSSPVLRGKFVREQLLCQILPPPPNDVMVELPALDPRLTTRERFARHQSDPSCAGCHRMIDPIGLGFERFDAIGRYREVENGKPVDASGEIVGMTGGKFNGVIELAKKLAASEDTAECVARQWFRFSYGREEEAGVDDCTIELLKRKFMANGLKFRDLLVALTQTDAFLYRRVTPAGGAP